jgi:hypothetical protein
VTISQTAVPHKAVDKIVHDKPRGTKERGWHRFR